MHIWPCNCFWKPFILKNSAAIDNWQVKANLRWVTLSVFVFFDKDIYPKEVSIYNNVNSVPWKRTLFYEYLCKVFRSSKSSKKLSFMFSTERSTAIVITLRNNLCEINFYRNLTYFSINWNLTSSHSFPDDKIHKKCWWISYLLLNNNELVTD